MSIIKGLNNILFPNENICFFCNDNKGNITDFLCDNCKNKLEYLNEEIKIDCSYIGKIVYSLFYNNFIKRKIYEYKYYGKNYLYKPLGAILVNTIEEKFDNENIDIITYVPIHRRKKALRGYDQSELIAKYIGNKLDISLSKGNLIRKKWTTSQNKLNKTQRIKNLENAFYIKKDKEFVGKKILLIDDIITTGITMKLCSQILMEKGAKQVYGLAIASGRKW